MSFKHVVGSNAFKKPENQFDKEWEWFANQQNGKYNVQKDYNLSTLKKLDS